MSREDYGTSRHRVPHLIQNVIGMREHGKNQNTQSSIPIIGWDKGSMCYLRVT